VGLLRRVRLTPVVLVLAVVGGCSRSTEPKGVVVHVRVVENGQPVKFLANEEITVGLSEEVPAGQKGVGVSADISPGDATATLSRAGKTGVPPGKYRVSLSSQIGYSGDNRFDKVFAGKPPLIVAVGPEEGQTFTVDIARWTVTK
jgi:hypothetical protein